MTKNRGMRLMNSIPYNIGFFVCPIIDFQRKCNIEKIVSPQSDVFHLD